MKWATGPLLFLGACRIHEHWGLTTENPPVAGALREQPKGQDRPRKAGTGANAVVRHRLLGACRIHIVLGANHRESPCGRSAEGTTQGARPSEEGWDRSQCRCTAQALWSHPAPRRIRDASATATRRLRDSYTTATRRLRDSYTTAPRQLHDGSTTATRQLHDGSTTTGRRRRRKSRNTYNQRMRLRPGESYYHIFVGTNAWCSHICYHKLNEGSVCPSASRLMYNYDLPFRNGMQPNEALLPSSIPVRRAYFDGRQYHL